MIVLLVPSVMRLKATASFGPMTPRKQLFFQAAESGPLL